MKNGEHSRVYEKLSAAARPGGSFNTLRRCSVSLFNHRPFVGGKQMG